MTAPTQATLRLARTAKHFGFGDADDHVVLDGGRVIGRIFRHPQGPEGTPWFWTITAPDIPPSTDKSGYGATLEEAMTFFKARWLAAGTNPKKPSYGIAAGPVPANSPDGGDPGAAISPPNGGPIFNTPLTQLALVTAPLLVTLTGFVRGRVVRKARAASFD